jgi:hypothetical protein
MAMLARHPVPFERGDKWGYKDAAGGVAIQPRFETAGEFAAPGRAAAADEGRWACPDLSGAVLGFRA